MPSYHKPQVKKHIKFSEARFQQFLVAVCNERERIDDEEEIA
jgi:hypothetical protein